MTAIPFISPEYRGRIPNQNYYYEADYEGGKPALVGTPGLKPWCTPGSSDAEIRGLFRYSSTSLYAVSGATAYSITTAGEATSVGTLNSSTGKVWIDRNATQIMFCDGVTGYTYTPSSGTFAEIADADFPGCSSLTVQDGYGIVTKPSSQEVWISGINNFTTWDALDYEEAIASPDNLVCALSDRRELWLFGEETTEVFQNTGAADFPFERIQGVILSKGIGAAGSAAINDNAAFWLTNEGTVVRAVGYTPQIISTRQLEDTISKFSTISDALGWSVVYKGHAFYFLAFPTADQTWVYDAATNMWFRHSSFPDDSRHRSNCYAFFARKHLMGDYDNGIIYEYDPLTFTDNGQPIRSIMVSMPIADPEAKKIVRHNRLEVQYKAGVGLVSGQGSDPQAMLEYSDDDGNTWSNEIWTGFGVMGDYSARAVWDRMGTSRWRIYRQTISDPVERVVKGVFFNASVGYR